MLTAPHIVPLTEYVSELRSGIRGEVPDFDPADGGVLASILFLFEKPGPMTSVDRRGRVGSGFVSRDNDDPTAEATFLFMKKAELPRQDTVIWNLIPWWDGQVKFSGSDRNLAMHELEKLKDLLPNLQTVVLVGRTAQKAAPFFRERNLRVLESYHPSPRVRASLRAKWEGIPDVWRLARNSVK